MHPLLTRPRQLGLYLLAWVPLAGILVYLLTGSSGLNWREAIILTLPLCLVYAFACLSAWYPCRALPLERSGFVKLALVHLTDSALVSVLWVQIAKGFAVALVRWGGFTGLDQRLAKYTSLLWVTGVLLYLLSVTFYYMLLAEQASREAQERALQARVLARDAELKALRAQVNPHFLFNCLHSISALTSSDAAKAREMCILLGDFLRRTLGLGEKQSIPLEEEMSLVHAFLAVEKIRYGARLQMEELVDKEALNAQVPPLLLQPLVENAVSHGIANLVEGGWIRLEVKQNNGYLRIAIENLFDPEAPQRHRNGVGLANVRQRLQARYGDGATFGTTAEEGRFRVAISLPAEGRERTL